MCCNLTRFRPFSCILTQRFRPGPAEALSVFSWESPLPFEVSLEVTQTNMSVRHRDRGTRPGLAPANACRKPPAESPGTPYLPSTERPCSKGMPFILKKGSASSDRVTAQDTVTVSQPRILHQCQSPGYRESDRVTAQDTATASQCHSPGYVDIATVQDRVTASLVSVTAQDTLTASQCPSVTVSQCHSPGFSDRVTVSHCHSPLKQ